MSPGRRAGRSRCPTLARKHRPLIGPSRMQGAMISPAGLGLPLGHAAVVQHRRRLRHVPPEIADGMVETARDPSPDQSPSRGLRPRTWCRAGARTSRRPEDQARCRPQARCAATVPPQAPSRVAPCLDACHVRLRTTSVWNQPTNGDAKARAKTWPVSTSYDSFTLCTHNYRCFARYGMRLVARFVVLLVALSVMFDLMGQISVDYLELEGPFEPDKQALFSALYLGVLNEDWGKGSLTGLLWHYIPAIVLSLSIAIAWVLIDMAWATKDFWQKAHMNTTRLPHLPRLALRFVVLLIVLSFLFDLIGRTCFDLSRTGRAFPGAKNDRLLRPQLRNANRRLGQNQPCRPPVALSTGDRRVLVGGHRLDFGGPPSPGLRNIFDKSPHEQGALAALASPGPALLGCIVRPRRSLRFFQTNEFLLRSKFADDPPYLLSHLLGKLAPDGTQGGLPGLAWHYLLLPWSRPSS